VEALLCKHSIRGEQRACIIATVLHNSSHREGSLQPVFNYLKCWGPPHTFKTTQDGNKKAAHIYAALCKAAGTGVAVFLPTTGPYTWSEL